MNAHSLYEVWSVMRCGQCDEGVVSVMRVWSV